MKYCFFAIVLCFLLFASCESATRFTKDGDNKDDRKNDQNLKKDGCECIKHNCGCCVYVYENNHLCSNLTLYYEDDYGFQVTLTYGNFPIINKTITAKHPPPICVLKIPDVDIAEVCLQFDDMEYDKKFISGCLKAELEFFKILPVHLYKIGCFKIPLDGLTNSFKKLFHRRTEENSTIYDETWKADFVPFVQMI